MDWVKIFETSLHNDLRHLLSVLSGDGIACRIIEANGKQALLIRDSNDVGLAQQRIGQWQDNSLPTLKTPEPDTRYHPPIFSLLLEMPVVFLTALLSLVGFLIVYFDIPSLEASLVYQTTYIDHGIYRPQPEAGFLVQGAWWKILTPTFLHFSIFHLLFNLFWLFEFGGKIERYQSSARVLLVILITAVVANVAQYLYQPEHIFGGLSGAVYGLLAYSMLHARLYHIAVIKVRKEIEWFLIAWLLIGMTGILSLLGVADVANAAHLVGLVAGLLLAFIPHPKNVQKIYTS